MAPSDLLYLVHSAQAGNEAAVQLLLDRFRPLIEATATTFANDASSRADLIQDATVAFLSAIKGFRHHKSPAFPAYARRVLWNACVKSYRRYWPDRTLVQELPDTAMEQAFHRLLVDQLVRILPEMDQALIVRTYGLDGQPALSASKAGEELGIAPSTARRRHQAALAALRGHLIGE